jgi:hypothetical protein
MNKNFRIFADLKIFMWKVGVDLRDFQVSFLIINRLRHGF